MSTKHLTPQMIQRTVHVIDASGILDLICPPRVKGDLGRIGNIRPNTRLLLIGMHLCARLGHETTLRGIHQTLTEALPRQTQWDLGVLRPLTSGSVRATARTADPDAPRLTNRGKAAKRRWADRGYEELGYDDVVNAMKALRKRLDYGPGTASKLSEEVRAARRLIVSLIVDRLIVVTTVPRTGDSWAVDATGYWVWSRGHRGQAKTQAGPDPAEGDIADQPLEAANVAIDEDGATAPADQDRAEPAHAKGRCQDAAWGYRTTKDGQRDTAFGFHMHTLVRVPDATAADDSEPLLVDGFALVPANADVVDVTLDLVDRIRERHVFRRLIGDNLYTHLRADRWAVPLAHRGVEQSLTMSSKHHGLMDIAGAQMMHHWLHCPVAPMDDRPREPESISEEGWAEFVVNVEAFKKLWAFDRKESGLGPTLTSKWICPARAGRVGCHALGPNWVAAAVEKGLPVITPPQDWRTRDCCTNRTIDFTPNPANSDHQRKLAQREYFGSRRWRRQFNRRTYVEGAFGILKNASRLRLRRGQNRIAGLAASTIITAIKVALFNEEQLRAWHETTGLGPADHPLLQLDPPYWGFIDLTEQDARDIDRANLLRASARRAASAA